MSLGKGGGLGEEEGNPLCAADSAYSFKLGTFTKKKNI